MNHLTRIALTFLALAFGAHGARAQQTTHKDFHFNSLVAHWSQYDDPDYLPFLTEARPEVAQVGFYGVTFYSLAHTPFGKGYPAHLPVQGTAECGAWFENLNTEIHKRGIKMVGHFNTTFIFGDPAKNTGFFEWYNKGWDEKIMGPKPVADPIEMLEKDADGKPISSGSYSIGGWPEFHGCLNNPAWRSTLKAMVKVAVGRGVDGLIANYFYRHGCMCPHCQMSFRAYLAQNYTPEELRSKLGIADLAAFKFTEIPAWHDPATTNPYKMAAITWSQISLKRAFDDVFLSYGRRLKPDLITAQWNHLGNFSQISGDERSALPGDLWGRGEDYLWYSTGDAAARTDLKTGYLGDGTLQLRYIRGAFGDKSFLLGKYEQTRIRASIAEGVANGGAGMGFYANFKQPEGRAAFKQYFGFLRANKALYEGAQPAGELALLYPRSAVHQGDIGPVDRFRKLGRRLLTDHYSFDVIPDDLLTAQKLRGYKAVAYVDETALSAPAREALKAFPGAKILVTAPEVSAEAAGWNANQLAGVTKAEGSPTVVLSVLAGPAGRDGRAQRLMVHLVNYNRTEPPASIAPTGRGPQDELPLAVENMAVKLRVPAGRKVKSVKLVSPDDGGVAAPLRFEKGDGAISFTVPQVLVYSVAVVELD